MTPTDALHQLINACFAVWNEGDAGRRAQALRHIWDETGTYSNTRGQAVGADKLNALIGTVLSARPSTKVIRSSAIDSHHRMARFEWTLVQGDGTALRDGVDFAEMSTAGKILRVVGFFGLPERIESEATSPSGQGMDG